MSMHEVNNSETNRIANSLELAQVVAGIAVYICALLYSTLCHLGGNQESSSCYLDSRGVLFGAIFYLLNFRLWKIFSKRFLVSDLRSSQIVPIDPTAVTDSNELLVHGSSRDPARPGSGIALLAIGKMGILLAAISLALTASNALIISSLAGFTAVMILGIFLAPIFLRRKQRG